MKLIIYAYVSFLVSFLVSSVSWASCLYSPPAKVANKAKFIFVGKVESLTPNEASVSITKVYKGKLGKKVKVVIPEAQGFKLGYLDDVQLNEAHLFSITTDLKDDSLEIHRCDWKTPISLATKDISWLEANKNKLKKKK